MTRIRLFCVICLLAGFCPAWLLSFSEASPKPSFQICANCHTMHSSQNGSDVRGAGASIQGAGTGECLDCHAQNRAMLLKMDCIGCHSSVNSASNVDPVTQAPYVAHSGTDLAAGNFRYLFGFNNRLGHNVHGFGTQYSVGDLGNRPPGYDTAYDPSTDAVKYNFSYGTRQIMCAGVNGCHGDRNVAGQIEAVRGAHHEGDAMLKAGTLDLATQAGGATTGEIIGRSFRFLRGVKGLEDDAWEGNATAAKHNEYLGSTGIHGDTQSWADIDTVSEFCAECHGPYHSATGMGTGNPWLRHPTDVALPGSGEYLAYATYSLTVPVARVSTNIGPNSSSTVNPSGGGEVVMCLSCHRAHGSQFDKALRWDYKSSNVGTALTGCAVCHTSMN